jgi:hypothetical protein
MADNPNYDQENSMQWLAPLRWSLLT